MLGDEKEYYYNIGATKGNRENCTTVVLDLFSKLQVVPQSIKKMQVNPNLYIIAQLIPNNTTPFKVL